MREARNPRISAPFAHAFQHRTSNTHPPSARERQNSAILAHHARGDGSDQVERLAEANRAHRPCAEAESFRRPRVNYGAGGHLDDAAVRHGRISDRYFIGFARFSAIQGEDGAARFQAGTGLEPIWNRFGTSIYMIYIDKMYRFQK